MSRFDRQTPDHLSRQNRIEAARVAYQRLVPEQEMLCRQNSNRFSAWGIVYEQRMNLPNELDSLPPGSVVWDLGGGTFVAPREMLQTDFYGGLRFVGVDFTELPDPWDSKLPSEYDPMGTPPRFTFIKGYLEELSSSVADQARRLGLYPPAVLLASNALQYPSYYQTLDIVFKEIQAVMDRRAKLLVYEDGQDIYSEYIKQCRRLSLSAVKRRCLEQNRDKFYLRITRQR